MPRNNELTTMSGSQKGIKSQGKFAPPPNIQSRTGFDFGSFTLSLSDLLIGVGFGPVLTFKTNLLNAEITKFFTFSSLCIMFWGFV